MTPRLTIKKIFRRLLMVSVLCSMTLSVHATAPVVKARLDSVSILMGHMTTLRLQVVQDNTVHGTFPLLAPNDRGYAAVCGDSVELRTSIKRDTTRLGSGRIQIDWQVPVQSFDSGAYRLPELMYVADRDTVYSDRLSLKVVPVQAKADDPISPLASPADPYGKSFWDWVPDWLADFWWIGLFAFMVALICFEEVIRRKPGVKLPTIVTKKPVSPWEEALEALDTLKESKLWEQGQEKEYFTRLTDILRVYLQKMFGINAMEMTSRQIMQTLGADPELREKRGLVRQILDMADFVKFAKVRPLPDDNIAAWNNSVAFIRDTIPSSNTDTPKEENISIGSGDVNHDKSFMKKGGEA